MFTESKPNFIDNINKPSFVCIYPTYIFYKKIGAGSFGDVYMVYYNNIFIAIKIEKKTSVSRLFNEFNIYRHIWKYISNNNGIPLIYSFLQTSDYNMLGMELLGPNLEKLFLLYKKKFPYTLLCNIAVQILDIIEHIHSICYIHRDIKPSNFVVRMTYPHDICITDFGLSRLYIKNNRHITQQLRHSMIGTARYASINVHELMEPSRRDDLISIGYMLVYFLKGHLPWQNIIHQDDKIQYQREIGMCKRNTSISTLCQDIPISIQKYLWYCTNLSFTETPQYNYLKSLFIESVDSSILQQWSTNIKEYINKHYQMEF
jgi:serine/threonine protein kinase